MTDCKMFALVPAVAATVLNGKTICTARAVIRRECSSTRGEKPVWRGPPLCPEGGVLNVRLANDELHIVEKSRTLRRFRRCADAPQCLWQRLSKRRKARAGRDALTRFSLSKRYAKPPAKPFPAIG